MSSPTLTFTSAMFHASLMSLKDTTRRVITADCFRSDDGRIKFLGDSDTVKYPPHAPGQIKPMVTSWRVNGSFDNCKPSELDPQQVIEAGGLYWENVGSLRQSNGNIHSARFSHESKLYPGRFLPKALYELAPKVEILTVTPEFLHDITEDGAKREGISQITKDQGSNPLWKYGLADKDGLPGTDDFGWPWNQWQLTAREAYFKLWDTINAEKDGGKYASQHNPACWVITFRVLPHA